MTAEENFARHWPVLTEMYPDVRCGLNYHNAFELLVATILSAQCTDERVNIVTPPLFARYPNPAAMAEASLEEMEQMVRSTGFYHNKAKNIIATSQMITRQYGGNVPDTMEQLVLLPGAARKTAAVVLGNAFNKNEGIAVDTHVMRLSHRLGWTQETAQEKIERDLMHLAPREEWTNVNHRLVWHGRLVCFARKPNCLGCALSEICPSSLARPIELAENRVF